MIKYFLSLALLSPLLSKKLSKLITAKTVKLKNKDQILASAGHYYFLPVSPKKGDSIFINVPFEALQNKALVDPGIHKIFGENRLLGLTQLAAFGLTYSGPRQGWLIS